MMTSTMIDGKVYLAGGTNSTVALDSMEIFDLATQTVKPGPQMIFAHTAAGLIEGKDHFTTFAGTTVAGGYVHTTRAQRYDVASNSWQEVVIAPLNARGYFSYSTYDNRTIAVGGRLNGGSSTTTSELITDNTSTVIAYLKVGEKIYADGAMRSDVPMDCGTGAGNVTALPASTECTALADTRVYPAANISSGWVRRGGAGGPIQIGTIVPTMWTDDVVRKNGEVWLKMNGQAVDPAQYPALVSQITTIPQIVTPVMTSLTTPAPYVITESSSYHPDSKERGWFAFDQQDGTHINTNTWSSGAYYSGGVGNEWLSIDLTQPTVVDNYTIRNRGTLLVSPSNDPADWVLEGSTDNSNWVVLDTKISQTFTVGYQPINTTFANTTAYRYYRFRVTKINGSNAVCIGEIELNKNAHVLPDYGTNAQGQYSYIKAAGYTNNGYTLPDGGNIGDTLVWNGSQWAVVAAATTSASPLMAPLSAAGALQFNDLADQVSTVAATVGQVEETVGDIEQTLGFSEENTLDDLITKINLLNQLSSDSYQLATDAATFALTNSTNHLATLSLSDVATLDHNGSLRFTASVEFTNEVYFSGTTLYNPDTAGVITVPVGTDSATHTFAQPLKFTPIVQLTPTGSLTQLNYSLTEVTSNGFTLAIDQPATQSVRFNWSAIQVKY
jgi:hypothetical protein